MLSYLLNVMLQRSPLLVVLLTGIAFAIARWKRHPWISFFTVLGLVLYLLKIFLFAQLFYSIPRLQESMRLSYGAAINLYILLHILSDMAFAGVIIILVIAAFAQRRPAAAIYNQEGHTV